MILLLLLFSNKVETAEVWGSQHLREMGHVCLCFSSESQVHVPIHSSSQALHLCKRPSLNKPPTSTIQSDNQVFPKAGSARRVWKNNAGRATPPAELGQQKLPQGGALSSPKTISGSKGKPEENKKGESAEDPVRTGLWLTGCCEKAPDLWILDSYLTTATR